MSFRFSDLAPEIRGKILEYTDLVTPLRHVKLDRRKLDGCAKSCHINGAYYEVPPSDWRPPVALFLVSRAFSALAYTIFLSQNHFEVRDGELTRHLNSVRTYGPYPKKPDINDAARFLKSPVRSAYLSSIKSMDIIWPTFLCTIIQTQGLKDWHATIEKFRSSFRPRRLIIHTECDVSIPIYRESDDVKYDLRRDHFDQAGIIDRMRDSIDMFWPIERLAQPDGVQMFLWSSDNGDGEMLAYFCRHKSERLPVATGEELFLHGQVKRGDAHFHHPAMVRWQRPFARHSNGKGDNDQNLALETSAGIDSDWIEGIYMQPSYEDESWGWDVPF